MTLYELTKDLFVYLVRFREKAPDASAPNLAEVRGDLLRIFARMDARAKSNIFLKAPYEQVRYALVVFADEVALTSGWEHSRAWRDVPLEHSCFGTKQGAHRFFELAQRLDGAPQDVVAVYYLCLALGFTGRYQPGDRQLDLIKEKLLSHLPSPPKLEPDAEAPPQTQAKSGRGGGKAIWAAVGGVLAVALVWIWSPWAEGPGKGEIGKNNGSQTVPSRVSDPRAPRAVKKPEPRAGKPRPVAAKTAPPEVDPEPAPELVMPEAAEPETPPAQAAPPGVDSEPAPRLVMLEAPEPGKPPGQAEQEKTYRLRVGVFVGPLQSGRLAQRIKGAGIPASVKKSIRPGGNTWYLVYAGPVDNWDEALKLQARIKREFGILGIIKKIGQ